MSVTEKQGDNAKHLALYGGVEIEVCFFFFFPMNALYSGIAYEKAILSELQNILSLNFLCQTKTVFQNWWLTFGISR